MMMDEAFGEFMEDDDDAGRGATGREDKSRSRPRVHYCEAEPLHRYHAISRHAHSSIGDTLCVPAH